MDSVWIDEFLHLNSCRVTSLPGKMTGIIGRLKYTGNLLTLKHVLNLNISIRNYNCYVVLETLNIKQLKLLAIKHHVTVKGDVEEGWFETRRFAPTKRQYINKLSGIVTEKELSSIPKDTPTKVKRKRG